MGHKPYMMEKADIIIIGGGLVGLTQALALAKHGISSHVVDRADPEAMLAHDFDGRTSAISSSSMKMFEAIGLGEAVGRQGLPDRTDLGQRRPEARFARFRSRGGRRLSGADVREPVDPAHLIRSGKGERCHPFAHARQHPIQGTRRNGRDRHA